MARPGPRSALSADYEPPLSVLAEVVARSLAGIHQAIRQWFGGRERAGLCHCSDSHWGRSADDRIVLRRQFATINQPLRACNSPRYRATLIHIAVPGTYNADTNPSRIAPHDLLDVALGSQVCGRKITIANLSDGVALYNFLSSFSGTHFIRPAPLNQS